MVGLLIAAAVAMFASLIGTRFLISWLRARNVGQPIHEDMAGHSTKAGTPTMGGLAIMGAAVLGYGVAHLRGGVIFTYSGLILMLAVAGAGAVGLIDDWIKVKHERNLGLTKGAKTLGLLTVAIAFAVVAVTQTDVHTTLSFTRFTSTRIELGSVGWVVLAVA
ncbi:MAG: phospho-N-acetylmuramoyl-pentapeptide-transferase, partial [Acidimicrobiales bacterium]